QAQPTTAGASGSFVDLNGDGCKRAGAGFIASTNPATDGPITVGPSPGPLRPQSYDGTVAAVSAAVSEVFSGPNSPIRDIGFVAITPQQPIATHSAVSCSCTPTAGCPEYPRPHTSRSAAGRAASPARPPPWHKRAANGVRIPR